MTTTKQVTWTLTNGKQATVTVALVTSRVEYADGHNVEVPCCDLDIYAEVEGMGRVGSGQPRPAETMTAKIGKLGLTQEQLDLVNTAIAEIEAMPEWQAQLASERQWVKDEAEYEAHSKMMARAMGGSY